MRNSVRFKIEKLQGDFLTHKIQMENAQALILLTQSKLEKSTSGTSSRNSSPQRPYMVCSNADSLKPQTLSYSDATVTTVKEHLKTVKDWMNNIYPGGYTFPHYLSNFTSTIDRQFSIKADKFESCKTEDDL